MSGAQKRIAAAVIFAAGLVSVALFMRSDRPETVISEESTAVSVVAAPDRQAIAEKDSNNDGVPDWQETLQVTAPIDLEAADDTYTPPETLTGQFAIEFFQDMVRAENYGEFGDSPEELVASAGSDLVQKAYDVLLDRRDIIILEDNSKESLAQYGESIARIIVSAPVTDTDNEAVILERALRNQDPNELQKLEGKLAAYTYMLEETLKTPAPSSMTKVHLDLANTYQALIVDIKAMKQAFDDPMMALLRMKRYQDDADGLYASIMNIFNSLILADVSWQENSIVFEVISIGEDN